MTIDEALFEVRRGNRTHLAVKLVCDELERLLAKERAPKRDRKEYMRGYMREYRANKSNNISK